MSRRIMIAASALLSLVVALVAQPGAAAAEPAIINTNPVDWTVVTPFVGALGDEIPLRVGQSDYKEVPGLILPGFGERHILAAHGDVPSIELIDEILQDGECVSKTFERFTCTLDEAEVVFLRVVDPRSGDGLPVGIVSAYFKAPAADE